MSTNKTQNYNLHSWLPQDEFHVSEINENFTALDADAARLVHGTFVGPGGNYTLQVNLGFRPKAVFAMISTGVVYSASGNECYITFTRDGMDDGSIAINANGFWVHTVGNCRMTAKDTKYNYLALR